MADIAAGDVTYALQEGTQSREDASRFRGVFKVDFGDGVDTYPTGGVPLTKADLACPNRIIELHFVDAASANGFVYKYDWVNEKIRIYQGDNDAGADGPLVELAGGVATPAAATLYVSVLGW